MCGSRPGSRIRRRDRRSSGRTTSPPVAFASRHVGHARQAHPDVSRIRPDRLGHARQAHPDVSRIRPDRLRQAAETRCHGSDASQGPHVEEGEHVVSRSTKNAVVRAAEPPSCQDRTPIPPTAGPGDTRRTPPVALSRRGGGFRSVLTLGSCRETGTVGISARQVLYAVAGSAAVARQRSSGAVTRRRLRPVRAECSPNGKRRRRRRRKRLEQLNFVRSNGDFEELRCPGKHARVDAIGHRQTCHRVLQRCAAQRTHPFGPFLTPSYAQQA